MYPNVGDGCGANQREDVDWPRRVYEPGVNGVPMRRRSAEQHRGNHMLARVAGLEPERFVRVVRRAGMLVRGEAMMVLRMVVVGVLVGVQRRHLPGPG